MSHLTKYTAIRTCDTLDCVVRTIDIVILIHCWISIHINILGCNLSICEELLCPLLACNKTSLTM